MAHAVSAGWQCFEKECNQTGWGGPCVAPTGPVTMSREDWIKIVRAEIQHNISPVIGWLRMDAAKGRVDTDQERLKEFNDRVDKAAEDIATIIERNMT